MQEPENQLRSITEYMDEIQDGVETIRKLEHDIQFKIEEIRKEEHRIIGLVGRVRSIEKARNEEKSKPTKKPSRDLASWVKDDQEVYNELLSLTREELGNRLSELHSKWKRSEGGILTQWRYVHREKNTF